MSIIFDIETRPQTKALELLKSDFPNFDKDIVPIGNLKDAEKIKQKIIDAGIAHELKRAEFDNKQHKKACLDADYGMLSAIGVLHLESGEREIIDAKDESKALATFWHFIDEVRSLGQWAFGWNIEGFDIPFLLGRSRLLGVHYDPYMVINYRYFDKCFVDLHKVWTFGAYGKFCSLKKASKALGFQHKELPVTGGTFYENWESDDEASRDFARQYLIEDLEQTLLIAKATHGVKEGEKQNDLFNA